MYVKLFGSILDSSIWSADPNTRLLWITMLAMADEFGIVYASVDGLAHRARISEDDCIKAVAILEGPDKHSRDGTSGERIRRLTGGWELLNYQHYREMRTREQVAASVRKQRSRSKNRDTSRKTVTRHVVTTEAEAVSRSRKQRGKQLPTPTASSTNGTPTLTPAQYAILRLREAVWQAGTDGRLDIRWPNVPDEIRDRARRAWLASGWNVAEFHEGKDFGNSKRFCAAFDLP